MVRWLDGQTARWSDGQKANKASLKVNGYKLIKAINIQKLRREW